MKITNEDRIKAIRKGSRDAEFEVFGPGFHSKTKIKKSKKIYNRRQNKIGARNCADFLFAIGFQSSI